MCSTPIQRIAEIGHAIDDLAADARTAYRPAARKQRQPAALGDASPGESASPQEAVPAAGGAMSGAAAGLGGSERRITAPHDGAVAKTGAVSDADPASDADEVLIRLAALWGKLAELDPEVAKRLPTYDA